jgi:SAM-dependent methyltransferase
MHASGSSSSTARYREFYEQKALAYPELDAPALARCEKAVGLGELAPGQRVLDIACKDAVLLAAIGKAGLAVDYVGLDISERVVTKNQERGLSGTYVCANILEGAPFGDQSFDRVFALEILEHVPGPERLLQEAHRMLRDNGRLLLSVPNPYYYMELVNELRRRPDTDGHLFSFTNANIHALLGHCGFEVEASLGTYFLIPRTLRHPFRDLRFWVVKSVPELLACSRVYRCRKR